MLSYRFAVAVFVGTVLVTLQGILASGVEGRRSSIPVLAAIHAVDEDVHGTQSPCPGDANGDGSVDIDDLILVIEHWLTPGPADVTGDGIVNMDDLLVMIHNWGTCV